jgi:pyruvate dehydrogenase E2 component (dihydrolipoamide acetyltransferase)
MFRRKGKLGNSEHVSNRTRQPSERAHMVDGGLAVRPVVQASLAADHRASDGHVGARFLTTLDAALQEPAQLERSTA